MNLIELSNQLKDVPDQFLLKEVQAPSGAYPAYMVVTELTRRKRMRESAAKEMPETTVAEDLVGEQERAQAMAQVQNQMAQQAQPMIPPQESLNAPSMGAMGGLGALPEAQGSLAAQDAMGTTPPEMMMPVQGMAGGGMVSFKEGGNVIRAYDGLPGSMFDVDPESVLFVDLEEQDRKKREADMYRRFEEGQKKAADIYSGKTPLDVRLAEPIIGKKGVDLLTKNSLEYGKTEQEKQEQKKDEKPKSTEIKIPSLANIQDPFATERAGLVRDISGFKYKTPDQLEQDRQIGRSRYESEVPFRLGFLEQEIAKRQKDVEGRRDSNINEALIQTGLKIMGSKSPRFLQAVSEGGLSGLDAYRQGKKDIERAEDALMQSRVSFANAQTLYDQGKNAAGDKALETAKNEEARALALKNSQYTVFKNEVDNARQNAIAASQIPYYQTGAAKNLAEAQYKGKTDTTPSPAEVGKAYEFADQQIIKMMMEKGSAIKIGSPEAARLRDEIAQKVLVQAGKAFVPISTGGTSGNIGGWSYTQNPR